ncbi:MAG TPA: nitroreductase family protein [Candidatus Binataceae bacterium]|jgi:nitroreductase|nr:nitroreductase family protein [Candidatus Binataceae bacterium]
MNEIGLFEAIHTSRALRRLKPDPVPDELITRILDAAIRAPSARNTRNWAFVAVKEVEQRRRIAEIYRKAFTMMTAMYRERRPAPHQSAAGYSKMMSDADHMANHLQEVPVIIMAGLMIPASSFKPPAEDAGAVASAAPRISGASIYPAVQNILLACRALGLGSVLTTIHAYYNDEVRAVLDLPAEFMTYAMLPIGYPMEGFGHGPVKRRPLSEVACLDRWGNSWRA